MQQKNELPESYELLGIKVHSFTIPSLLAFVQNIITLEEKSIIAHHNMHSIYLQKKNKSMQSLQVSSINIIDGMPIIYAGKSLNFPLKKDNRITWVDFIEPLVAFAAVNGYTIFYLGGKEQVVKKGTEIFKKNYPALNIFYANGFFNTEKNSPENKAVINKINESHAQILIVGMGMPRQEIWIQENKDALNTNIIFTSGAAIEYVAGAVKTPPRWMGRAGMEWLFRLTENPKRFWFRYMVEPWYVLALFSKEFFQKKILRK